jgi:glycosyltransferase involved in cell wall biosynthesis
MGRAGGLDDRIETGLERGCVESSGMIVAHSRALARELESYYGVPAGRVRVLYPPIDTTRFRPMDTTKRPARRAALGIADDDIAFLFPSMGHLRKGLPQLLEALRALAEPRAMLLVAGRRRNGVAERGSGLRIRDLDYVDDMPALYGAVDCTVLPSRYEPFGLVIAESLQCGTGVITASSAGVAELLSAHDGICVDPEDPSALTAALRRVCDGPLRPLPDFATRHGLERARHVEALVEVGREALARRPVS